MTARQKATFICELMASVQKSILAKINQMPPEWDDFELRQYIADQFIKVSPFAYQPELRLRAKIYKNGVIANRL
jgi:hypothetical protein